MKDISGCCAELNKRPACSRRGVALVSVLWILAFMTVVASGLSLQARTETRMARNLVSVAQAQEAASGAIQLAVFELLNGDVNDRRRRNGSIIQIALGDATVQVAVFDESGRIDLNKASAQTLGRLFAAVGLEDTPAAALTDAIIDWRDTDQLHRLNGAEDDDYESAGRAYGAKDGPFQSVEELQLVLGMTSEIYTKIWRAVTVLSPAGNVNADVASPLVRRATMDDPGDEGAIATGVEPSAENRPRRAILRGSTYSVYAMATVADGASARVGATVKIQRRNRNAPVAILNWRVEPRAIDTVFAGSGEKAPPEQNEG